MGYRFIAETDIGTTKSTNQDSLLVKQAQYNGQDVLMAVVCDGMGGLSKGELASTAVIKEFNRWFNEDLAYELEHPDLGIIGEKWSLMLKDMNSRMGEYARKMNFTMGTTFTGILFLGNEYVAVHVGDSRLYYLNSNMRQITEDQTYVAREVKRGNMTPEQAKVDKKRNLLLQCVGASDSIEPAVYRGNVETGMYMLCSDGFRHEISEDEMMKALKPSKATDKKAMQSAAVKLIDTVKKRNEKDNISVILVDVR